MTKLNQSIPTSPMPFPDEKENTLQGKEKANQTPTKGLLRGMGMSPGSRLMSPPGKKVAKRGNKARKPSSPAKPFSLPIRIENPLSPRSAQAASQEYRAMLRSGKKPGPVLGFRKYHYKGLNAEGNIYIGEKDL